MVSLRIRTAELTEAMLTQVMPLQAALRDIQELRAEQRRKEAKFEERLRQREEMRRLEERIRSQIPFQQLSPTNNRRQNIEIKNKNGLGIRL